MSSTGTPLLSSSKDNSKKSIADKILTGLSNYIKLLPTGTVFVFQFLNHVMTNNGNCTTLNKYLTSFFIAICGLVSGLSCFTDSYKDSSDGTTHYGVATLKGVWPSIESGSVDLSSYKLSFDDFIHAFFVMLVYAVVALLDPNTVKCFYPSFESSTEKVLLMVLPLAVGATSATVFVVFPNKRRWIGYHL